MGKEGKYKKAKILLTVFLCICIAMLLHAIPISENLNFKGTAFEHSKNILAETITFPGAAFIFFIIAYTVITVIYLKFQHNLHGNKKTKALTYGLTIGAIWWMGMYEMSALFFSNVLIETWTGLTDLIPIVILILLLSKYVRDDNDKVTPPHFQLRILLLYIFIFSVMFTVGRHITLKLGIATIFPKSPTGYFMWSILMGGVFGAAFYFLNPMSRTGSIISSTCRYVFLIFGCNWSIYVFFMIVIVGFDALPQCLIRISTDMITTIISELLIYKYR